MSSETPPPVVESSEDAGQQQSEIDLNTSTTDVNLLDDDDTTAAAAAAAALKKPQVLSDDLFFSAIAEPSGGVGEENNGKEDMDELFNAHKSETKTSSSGGGGVTKEIKLDDEDLFGGEESDSNKQTPSESVTAASIAVQPPAAAVAVASSTTSNGGEDATKFTSLASKKASLAGAAMSVYEEDDEDDEERDKFLEITLSDPSKVGEGMGSYIVYKLQTKTNIPAFKSKEFGTSRRFSDFLNLYEKLKEKHLAAGRILPPAPEKDMIGMAKVKMSKEDSTSPIDFLDRRKHSLQRFLTRLAKHKTFRYDPDFRDFLEISDELPKANNTSALSGAGMMKMFKNVTESVSKISLKMEETDQWFEEKSRQVENLYVQYKKMHNAVETMYAWRKDLATSTKDFSKHAAILANSEEQVSLSRALSQLGEIYEKVDQIYVEQANTDFFVFSELVRDYVALFDNIREVFHQRIKTYHHWKKTEETLKTKQDQKAKLEASNKLDKVPTVAAEIRDLEGKVEKGKEDFEQISKTIKEEIKRFDFERAKEFRRELLTYLNTLLANQETVVKIWEQFLPEVKAI